MRSLAELELLCIKGSDPNGPKRNRFAEALGIESKPRPPEKKDDIEQALDYRENKGIFHVKQKVDREIAANVVKADDMNDEWKEEMRKHEKRFKELHSDYTKRDRYVKREIDPRS